MSGGRQTRSIKLGIRPRVLLAPLVVLALMTIMGVAGYRQLNHSAELAKSSDRELQVVENLRDSNSRQFESDRKQHLALSAATADDFKSQREEALGKMQEAIDGFATFSDQARTPHLRQEALAQAALLSKTAAERTRLLEMAAQAIGEPLPPAARSLMAKIETQVDQADEGNDALVEGEQKVTDALARNAQASAARGKRLLLILLTTALALGVLVSLLVSQRLVALSRRLLTAARGIARGDVEQRVDASGTDELSATAAAFAEMVDYLREMAAAGKRIAAGDLTVRVKPRSEHDALGNAFAEMTDSLNDLLRQVTGSASNVSSASQQLVSTSGEAGSAVEEVASAINEVAAGAERQVRSLDAVQRTSAQVADVAQSSAATAQATATAAERAHSVAGEGAAAVAQATEAMLAVREASAEATAVINELGDKSREISGIVETITGISEQTNLLALNAAIEAARAGDHGRGFAVVADEVRKLAEESREASARIAALIEGIQAETARAVEVVEDSARRTDQGAATVEQARGAFERIGESVDAVTAQVRDIAAAITQIDASSQTMRTDVDEVANVAESTSASAEQVSATTQESSASTQEIAASAQSLAHTADELERLVRRFTLAA